MGEGEGGGEKSTSGGKFCCPLSGVAQLWQLRLSAHLETIPLSLHSPPYRKTDLVTSLLIPNAKQKRKEKKKKTGKLLSQSYCKLNLVSSFLQP